MRTVPQPPGSPCHLWTPLTGQGLVHACKQHCHASEPFAINATLTPACISIGAVTWELLHLSAHAEPQRHMLAVQVLLQLHQSAAVSMALSYSRPSRQD